MPAYFIVDLEVTDAAVFDEYRQLVPETIAKYGGTYLIRGGNYEALEGTWNPQRLVVIQFPSVEQARKWYDSAEYSGPKALRFKSAKSNLLLVEGV